MFTMKEFIEKHKLSADPENKADQQVVGHYLRKLGYIPKLVRIGPDVKRVWLEPGEVGHTGGDLLRQQLEALVTKAKK